MTVPPPSGLKVAKFGGTSVATAAQLRKVAAIVDADPERRIVVPSAPGRATPQDTKVTDLLYLCHQLASKGQPIDVCWHGIADRFLTIIADLGLDLDLAPHLAEARAAIIAGASADYAASRGEAIHGRILAALLGARYVDAAEVVFFDRAGRLDPRSYAAIANACAAPGRVVIPGFYGTSALGGIKTFSRGGSDVTGAVVAHAVSAVLYENWTDVSGVLMTDPRVVPEARPIVEITYRELRELSYMGASVLHEEAVFPVREKGIPINIRNTNRPQDPGTRIVAERDAGEQVVVGIAGTKGFTVINLEKALMNSEVGFGRRVLDAFSRLNISYEHTPTGIDTMSIVVSDRQLAVENGASRLDQVIEDLQDTVRPDTIKVSPGMALIATVGQGMNHAVGTAARLFASLARASVNVRMIDQGSSEQNIIVSRRIQARTIGLAVRNSTSEGTKPAAGCQIRREMIAHYFERLREARQVAPLQKSDGSVLCRCRGPRSSWPTLPRRSVRIGRWSSAMQARSRSRAGPDSWPWPGPNGSATGDDGRGFGCR
jgi:aspartate kinase